MLFILTMYEYNCPSITPHSCLASFLSILSFQPITQYPLLGSSPLTLVKMGAIYFKKSDRLHHAYRMFTCLWLHGGVIDLLLNMFNILYYDIYLEKKFGFVRIAILHTMSGMGISLFFALFVPTSVSVGASGAIMGLVGGTLSDLTMHPNKSIWTLIGATIIRLGLVLIIPQANNFGIVGGLIMEINLGYVLLISRTHSRFAPYQQALRISFSVLLTVGLIGGMVLFLKGVAMSDHCSWCHYLSCVLIKRSCKPNHVEIWRWLVRITYYHPKLKLKYHHKNTWTVMVHTHARVHTHHGGLAGNEQNVLGKEQNSCFLFVLRNKWIYK